MIRLFRLIVLCLIAGSELFAQSVQVLAVGRCPQTVVSHLVKAVRQDVLKEATDELVCRERHRAFVDITHTSVAEGNATIVE